MFISEMVVGHGRACIPMLGVGVEDSASPEKQSFSGAVISWGEGSMYWNDDVGFGTDRSVVITVIRVIRGVILLYFFIGFIFNLDSVFRLDALGTWDAVDF